MTHKKSIKIYTTGAYLTPIQVTDCFGNDLWIWSVLHFNDDSYNDGELCRPVEKADTIENLLITDNDDEDKCHKLPSEHD